MYKESRRPNRQTIWKRGGRGETHNLLLNYRYLFQRILLIFRFLFHYIFIFAILSFENKKSLLQVFVKHMLINANDFYR